MHSLTICFGPTGTIWTLLFKEESAAKTAASTLRINRDLKGLVQTLTDDFGQEITLSPAQVHAAMVEDMDASQMAQIERGLHQARTQAKAETRAMSDEVIKGAMRAKQMGPAVMSPVPGGRFNG